MELGRGSPGLCAEVPTERVQVGPAVPVWLLCSGRGAAGHSLSPSPSGPALHPLGPSLQDKWKENHARTPAPALRVALSLSGPQFPCLLNETLSKATPPQSPSLC